MKLKKFRYPFLGSPLQSHTNYGFYINLAEKTGRWKYRHGDSSWITYFDWAFTFGFQELGPGLDKRTDLTETVR